jgi:hypothetical protein
MGIWDNNAKTPKLAVCLMFIGYLPGSYDRVGRTLESYAEHAVLAE